MRSNRSSISEGHVNCIFSEAEKTLVEEVFNNATDTLSDEDKKLPQVSWYSSEPHEVKPLVSSKLL